MKELRDERAETGEKMRDLEAYIGHRRRRYVPVELGEQGQRRKRDGTGPLAEAKAPA